MLGLLPSVPLPVTSKSPMRPPTPVPPAPSPCTCAEMQSTARRALSGLQSRPLAQNSPRPSATATSSSQALQLPAAHPAQSRSHRFSELQAGSSLTSPGSYLHPNSTVLFAYQSLRSPPNLLEEVPLLSQILHKLLQFPQLL